jgi:boron transporter
VSSLIAQGTEFPLRKPAGFHWDFFLLGITTLVAGLLGLPFPYAHIPQSPFHTAALCVTRNIPGKPSRDDDKPKTVRVIDHVVEQRLSNLAQGLITLVTMTGPILTALNLIPQGVLAGLLFLMGVQALQSNGVTRKLIFLAQDQKLRSPSNPFNRVQRQRAIWGFVILEVVGFACILAVTQTIAAVGVPVMILSLIPVRSFLLPMVFTPEELAVLDEPTASPFTMESVGGITGFNFTVSHPEIGASGDSKIRSESGVIMRQEGSLRSTVPEDLEHGKVD